MTGYSAKTIPRGAKSISTLGLTNSSAKVMPAGSVHFSSRAPIGYVVISSEPLATNQGFKSLVPAPGIFNEYVYYYLIASRGYAHKRASGTTFLEISGKVFGRLPIPLAPTATQHRIVTKIEELFSELDQGVESLKTVRAQLHVYRQALLKHAFEGKLTAQWREEHPDAEPASELLQRILVERRRGWEDNQLRKFAEKGRLPPTNWKAKYKEPVAPNTADLSVLPQGWCWASVEQISTKVVDGVHKKPDYVPSGVPFVTVKNLTVGPRISFEHLNYITPEDHIHLKKRTDPERGDILVSKDGTLGVVRIIDIDLEFSIFVSVALIKPVLRETSGFFGMALSSPQVQQQMVPKGSGLVHIHLEDLRADCVPLPPIAEHHAILEAVENRLTVIGQIETEMDNQLLKADALRQSILKKAFSGQLVAQDPNDEPASILLDRIRAECERTMKNKTPRKTKKRKTIA